MIVSAAIQKMVEFYKGDLHDIDHFLKVWAMTKTIGSWRDWTSTSTHRRFWSLPPWCMTLPARCAGINTATPTASIRSWKVRRWWRRF